MNNVSWPKETHRPACHGLVVQKRAATRNDIPSRPAGLKEMRRERARWRERGRKPDNREKSWSHNSGRRNDCVCVGPYPIWFDKQHTKFHFLSGTASFNRLHTEAPQRITSPYPQALRECLSTSKSILRLLEPEEDKAGRFFSFHYKGDKLNGIGL